MPLPHIPSCLAPGWAGPASGWLERWVPGCASSLPHARPVSVVLLFPPSAGLSRPPPAGARIGAMTTIALITGANKGIGFETARLLGTRGMTVLVGARDETRGREAERALRAGGADARFVSLDVTDEKSVRQAAQWMDGEDCPLALLVNNAGS